MKNSSSRGDAASTHSGFEGHLSLSALIEGSSVVSSRAGLAFDADADAGLAASEQFDNDREIEFLRELFGEGAAPPRSEQMDASGEPVVEPPNLFHVRVDGASTRFDGAASAPAAAAAALAVVASRAPEALRTHVEEALQTRRVEGFDGAVVDERERGPVAFAQAMIKVFYPMMELHAQTFCARDFDVRR